MPLFKIWNKEKTVRKAVLGNSYAEFILKGEFSYIFGTRTTPIAGHLTVVSACSGGHLTTYFFKSQIPRGLPGGGG
jgi:hypothetical protein